MFYEPDINALKQLCLFLETFSFDTKKKQKNCFE